MKAWKPNSKQKKILHNPPTTLEHHIMCVFFCEESNFQITENICWYAAVSVRVQSEIIVHIIKLSLMVVNSTHKQPLGRIFLCCHPKCNQFPTGTCFWKNPPTFCRISAALSRQKLAALKRILQRMEAQRNVPADCKHWSRQMKFKNNVNNCCVQHKAPWGFVCFCFCRHSRWKS